MYRTAHNALALMVSMAVLCACGKPGTPAATSQTEGAAASAAAAPISADAYSFAIGPLRAVALRDGVLEFPNDNQVFGIGRTPAEVAALVGAAGLPTDTLQLSVQPLLVKTGAKVLLFDTGAAANFGPGAGKLPASLAAAGVDPSTVTDVFISHAHGDHVGGLVDAQGNLVFGNATIYMSAPEWDFLRGLDEPSAAKIGVGNLTAFIAAVTPKVVAFSPGTEILPGVVKSVEIKGHTPGHSGYLIGTGTDSLLYIGDGAHHSIVSVQKSEWPNGFDGDATDSAVSRKTLIEQSAASGQRIYAVHFPYPGIGRFEKRGGDYVWVAETPTAPPG